MDSVDISKFFVFQENDRTGDFRKFHIYCPYVEKGRGLRFHTSWRVSGTEEAMIGDDGVEQKIQKHAEEFKLHLLNEAEKNDMHFEVRGRQLWRCVNNA